MRTGCIPVLAYDEDADTYSEISSRGSRQLKARLTPRKKGEPI